MQVPTQNAPLKAHAAHRSFIADIVINHGPADLLGRLVLAADTAARACGVSSPRPLVGRQIRQVEKLAICSKKC
jgi:hypothetical protein